MPTLIGGDVQKRKEQLLRELEELEQIERRYGSLLEEKEIIENLAQQLKSLRIPAQTSDPDEMREALEPGRAAIEAAYNRLFGRRKRAAGRRGAARTGGRADAGKPRVATPINKALRASGEGMTDAQILNSEPVRKYLDKNPRVTREMILAGLRDLAADEKIILQNGKYYAARR